MGGTVGEEGGGGAISSIMINVSMWLSYHLKAKPYSPYLRIPMKQKIRAKHSLSNTEHKTELESQVKQ